MENLDIRLMVSENKLHYKDIANIMGVGQSWLSRLMASPLSLQNKLRIVDAIEQLKGGVFFEDNDKA